MNDSEGSRSPRQGASTLRLAVAGGGTGGHVLPAVAVIEELLRRGFLVDAVWIGSRDGLERQAAADAGARFIAIPTGKLRRYLSVRNITDAFRLPLGIVAARRSLRAFRPDVVLSTGGFVSVPTVIAARGVAPALTHEQTAILGLATRINARFADVLAVSYDHTRTEATALHSNVVVTGNPVRGGLRDGDRSRGLARFGFVSELPVVYVTGGARGASPINQRVAAMVPDLLEHCQILHQTGPASANADAASQGRQRSRLSPDLQSRYAIVEYLRDELPDVYAITDLAIGRAGAGTVAEFAVFGVPAILIPLPGAGGDEQTVNAKILAEAGAAVVMPQHEATPERLAAAVTTLLGDRPRLREMATAARSISRPDAAARLVDALLELARTAPTRR